MSHEEFTIEQDATLPTVIMLVGLPCSGKSTYGKRLAIAMGFGKEPVPFIDDPTNFNKQIFPVITREGFGKMTIVADPHLCRIEAREAAIKRVNAACGVEPHFIYFENNPEKCLANLERRKAEGDNREVKGCIKMYSKMYTIPEGARIIKIND